MTLQQFNIAIELIDAVNNKDPNLETSDGKEWPKELIYSHRMSDMLERYAPEADDVMQLSVRAQHIERWKSPRSDYPMNRKGYYLWRTKLYKFHAETTAVLLEKAGYENEFIERVKMAIGKKSLRSNPDTQLLEDVTALVFIEHYMLAFAESHPEYSEEKWLNIIRKTWNKMTDNAHQFVLNEHITLPEPLIPLIQKALN
jgi:hypothetical protein